MTRLSRKRFLAAQPDDPTPEPKKPIPAYLKGAGIVDGGDYERDDDGWFDPDRVATREALGEQLESRFAKIRASFIDEYGFMPYYIGPDGTPHRKGETT